MDPLHPILPVPVNIPPVTEPTRAGRIKRDDPGKDGRGQGGDQRKRREQRDEADAANQPGIADGNERRAHIDITA
jgi:hypothetical protein